MWNTNTTQLISKQPWGHYHDPHAWETEAQETPAQSHLRSNSSSKPSPDWFQGPWTNLSFIFLEVGITD